VLTLFAFALSATLAAASRFTLFATTLAALLSATGLALPLPARLTILLLPVLLAACRT
jgi:hypothetical protein